MFETLGNILETYGLITSFALVGLTIFVAYVLSDKLTKGRINGSAIAIFLGLLLAYFGGTYTGGEDGLADISMFTGIGLMGGGMFRDFAIIATAFGASFDEIKKAGLNGIASLFIGIFVSFIAGLAFALAFGYTDPVSLTTIGAGAVTYIVGPVMGASLGASSEVITISIAAGLVKSIVTIIGTPLIAKSIGLNSPKAAMVYGGLLGTTSGVAGGLAATNPKLVPYGAVTATFYTGLGLLITPLFYIVLKFVF